jgi:prepilin peptidase CpaA
MPDLPWLFIARFAVCLAVGGVAVVTDLRERRIPNWLTIPLLVAGVLFRGATEWGDGLLSALSGMSVGFGIFFVLWLAGGSAAGDVKFMAAVGAWLGPFHTFMVIVLSAILLLVCVVVSLVWRGIRAVVSTVPAGDKATKLSTQIVPYAVPAVLAIALRLAWMLFLGRTS